MKKATKGVSMRRKLARGLALGKPIDESMRDAGYSPSMVGHRQITYVDEKGVKHKVSPHKHPEIQRLVKQYQDAAIREMPEPDAELRRKTVSGIQDIVSDLELAFVLAKKLLNPNAMIQATMGKAKVLGLIVERREHSVKPLGQMNETELRMLIGEEEAPRKVH